MHRQYVSDQWTLANDLHNIHTYWCCWKSCMLTLTDYKQNLFMDNIYTKTCVHISHACGSEIIHTAYMLFVLCIHLCLTLRSVNTLNPPKKSCSANVSNLKLFSHLTFPPVIFRAIISDIWHSSYYESRLGSLNANKKRPWWSRPTRMPTVLPVQTAQKPRLGDVQIHRDSHLWGS